MTIVNEHLIRFNGNGAHRVLVAADRQNESAGSINIADIIGADFDTAATPDEFVVDSRYAAVPNEQCLLGRLHLRNVKLLRSRGGVFEYQGWLTAAHAYPSYESDPISDLYGAHKYLPPRHAALNDKLPMLVSVTVLPKNGA